MVFVHKLNLFSYYLQINISYIIITFVAVVV